MSYSREAIAIRILTILALVLSAFLALKGLDNSWFWHDEAQVAIGAQNFLSKGAFCAWDGRNLVGYRNGALIDERLMLRNPPLDQALCALSFKLFGPSTKAARLPFALVGLLSLGVFLLLLRNDFGRDNWLEFFSLGGLALSTSFLLFIRQCRYYALTMLFSLLVFYAYRRYMATRRIPWLVLFLLAAVLSFHANCYLGGTFLAALLLLHLVRYRKSLTGGEWAAVGVMVAAFTALVIPYALSARIWIRPDLDYGVREPVILFSLKSLWRCFRDSNLLCCFPWMAGVGLIYCWLTDRIPEKLRAPAADWTLLAFADLVFIALASPRYTADLNALCWIRYLVTAIPLLVVLNALFLRCLVQKSPLLAVLLSLTVLCTNVFTLTGNNGVSRWLLPSMIGEVLHDYPTAHREVVAYLVSHARKDDTVLCCEGYQNDVIQFYAGSWIRLCGNIDRSTVAPIKLLEQLKAPFFREENFPQWIIAYGQTNAALEALAFFSRPHMEKGMQKRYIYRLEKTLDIYCDQTQRPELPWHTFGPYRNYDPATQAVYIFRRSEGTGTGAPGEPHSRESTYQKVKSRLLKDMAVAAANSADTGP